MGSVEDAGNKIMNWLITRLKEGSTWRGLVWLLTVCGVLLTPEQTEAIVLAGMALAGLLGVFFTDNSKTTTKAELSPIDSVGTATPDQVRESVSPEYGPKRF